MRKSPLYNRLAGIAHIEPSGFTVLDDPCSRASIDPATKLCENDQSFIDDVDIAGRAMLYVAAMLGDAAKVEHMLEVGANPNIANTQGRTAMHAAVRAGSLSSLTILLKRRYRANINMQDAFGCTPLMNAVSRPNGRDVVHVLLQNGADVNIPNSKGWRPAHVLAAHNEERSLQDLAIAGADLNVRDEDGMNLLSMAIYNGANQVLEYLLSSPSVDNNARDCGLTILHFAALFGDIETLKTLQSPCLIHIEADAQNRSEKSALRIAEWRRAHNLDWFHEVRSLGPGNRGAIELDEDPHAWYSAFEELLTYLGSLKTPSRQNNH